MELCNKQYEVRINQFRSNFFRIRLVDKKKSMEKIVFETFADTIPSTREILEKYFLLNTGIVY